MTDQLKAKLFSQNAGNKNAYVVAVCFRDPRGAPIWCDVYSTLNREAAERFVGQNGFALVSRETR